MNKQLVSQVTETQIRKDLPVFNIGDTIKVMVVIRENNKERQQAYEGVVISIRGTGASKTFIVRKTSYGIGVERNFFMNSPLIASITVLKHAKVRRHKLYYLRERSGKSARLKEVVVRKEKPSKPTSSKQSTKPSKSEAKPTTLKPTEKKGSSKTTKEKSDSKAVKEDSTKK